MSDSVTLVRIDFPAPGTQAGPKRRAVVTFAVTLPESTERVEIPVSVDLQGTQHAKQTPRVASEAQYRLREHLLRLADALPERPPERPATPPMGVVPGS